jgi:bacillithiol system protein YtxJ
MFVELHEERDLGSFLARSQVEPVVIFKHSTQCSRSAAGQEELESFMIDHPEVPCGIVLVIEDRELSRSIEKRFGIVHESPQAIILVRGVPIWHGSHSRITTRALENGIAAARVSR